MTKCKRKLLPAEPYEIDALESWFSDLSAEGLHVQKANALYATFTEGEKKRLLFRMEPKQDGIFPALDESKAEERNAQHREKGWSFVCGLNRSMSMPQKKVQRITLPRPKKKAHIIPTT